MPSAAREAANTPWRAPLAAAQPFHIDSSPARVWYVHRLGMTASASAWRNASRSRPSRRPQASAHAITPGTGWSQPLSLKGTESTKRHWIS